MKIIYCIHSIYNPGGMERVLFNKVSYLYKKLGWDITIVTTDQHGRPPFYPFPKEIPMIDLGINYSEDNSKNIIYRIISFLLKRFRHKQKLSELLMEAKADIVVSLYPSESSFIPKIKDGSKKILELHFCKFFRLQYGRKGLLGLIDRWRTKKDNKIVRQFDKFVVLTREDMEYWVNTPNITVIPNAALFDKAYHSDVQKNRVIAVGRLDYQKGFDRLLKAWSLVQSDKTFHDWSLDIFGQGEWFDYLNNLIVHYKLEANAHIRKPTNRINEEYSQSSILVMSSNYEGFGMVLVEAMACGVPVIAFDCKCGPKDIINHGVNGFLVTNGNIEELADSMKKLMKDGDLRKRMSKEAEKVKDTYSEEVVMKQWIDLFSTLVRKA